jgi:cell filamentation protein
MSELNVIHPFREGNGRTIREFIRVLALERGYIIEWNKVSKEELLKASIDSVYDNTNLYKCLMQCAEKNK